LAQEIEKPKLTHGEWQCPVTWRECKHLREAKGKRGKGRGMVKRKTASKVGERRFGVVSGSSQENRFRRIERGGRVEGYRSHAPPRTGEKRSDYAA